LAAISKIAAILKKKQVADGFYQTNTLRGVLMPTFMLVPQSERFCLNSDLICRANCGTCHSNKLEKLQLEAVRIVTGLPIFTKTDSLYF
jgi:hypothetical protein